MIICDRCGAPKNVPSAASRSNKNYPEHLHDSPLDNQPH